MCRQCKTGAGHLILSAASPFLLRICLRLYGNAASLSGWPRRAIPAWAGRHTPPSRSQKPVAQAFSFPQRARGHPCPLKSPFGQKHLTRPHFRARPTSPAEQNDPPCCNVVFLQQGGFPLLSSFIRGRFGRFIFICRLFLSQACHTRPSYTIQSWDETQTIQPQAAPSGPDVPPAAPSQAFCGSDLPYRQTA